MGHVAVFTIRHTWASVGNFGNKELSTPPTWFRADASLAMMQFLTASRYRLNRQSTGLHVPLWTELVTPWL